MRTNIKRYPLLYIVLLMFGVSALAQDNNIKQFRIYINCSGQLWAGGYDANITQDSIIIRRSEGPDPVDSKTEYYKRKMTSDEKKVISHALLKINPDNLQKDYTDNDAPDDRAEFDFKLTINSNTKAFHIYEVKIPEIFELVRQINLMLPQKFRIGYDDRYFSWKK